MRLPKLDYNDMTPRQREAHDKHVAKRTRASGPYGVWLHSPELMNLVSPLSSYMRWDAALPGDSVDLWAGWFMVGDAVQRD